MTTETIKRSRTLLSAALLLAMFAHTSQAQKKRAPAKKGGVDNAEVAIVTTETAGVFRSPSAASAQLAEVKKGDKLWLTQPSNGGSWYAVITWQGEEVDGWIESSSVRLDRVELEEMAFPKGFVVLEKASGDERRSRRSAGRRTWRSTVRVAKRPPIPGRGAGTIWAAN